MSDIIDPETGEVISSEYDRLERIQNLEAAIGVRLDAFGHEVPDPRPMEIPAGFKRPETLQEQVARLVQGSISRKAAEDGHETFDESEDFEVDDDFDPSTPYEEFFDPALNRRITPDEFQRNADNYKKRYIKAQEQMFAQLDEEGFIEENLMRSAWRKRNPPSSGGEGGPPPSDSSPKAA